MGPPARCSIAAGAPGRTVVMVGRVSVRRFHLSFRRETTGRSHCAGNLNRPPRPRRYGKRLRSESPPDFDDWRTPELERVSKIRGAACVPGWAGRFDHARLVPLEGVVGGRRRIKNLTLDGDRARDARHAQRRGMVSCASGSCLGSHTCAHISPTRLPAYLQSHAFELSRNLCRTNFRGKYSVTTQTSGFSCFPPSLARFSRVFPPTRQARRGRSCLPPLPTGGLEWHPR